MGDSWWDGFTGPFGVKKIETLFDLDRILSCSAADYLNSQGKSPDKYRMVGVHYFGTDKEGFRKEVLMVTEVVVEYRSSIILLSGFIFADVCFDQYGVALISKS